MTRALGAVKRATLLAKAVGSGNPRTPRQLMGTPAAVPPPALMPPSGLVGERERWFDCCLDRLKGPASCPARRNPRRRLPRASVGQGFVSAGTFQSFHSAGQHFTPRSSS